MSANNQYSRTAYWFNALKLCNAILVLLAGVFSPLSSAAGWSEVRTSAAGKAGWQYVVCGNGSGWITCEVDLVITLTANPTQLVAIGQQATISAKVTDSYGNPVEAGVNIAWKTTDGTLSAPQTATDTNGQTSLVLTSSHTLGGATVTATAVNYGGSGTIYVPFIDQFVAIASVYTGWANTGSVYNCSAWSPDASTVAAGTWFTQYANCSQTQIQYRQDRQQSAVTGTILNVGSPVALYQVVGATIYQAAVGTMQPAAPFCFHDGDHSGGVNQGIFFEGANSSGGDSPAGGLSLWYNGPTGLGVHDINSSIVYNGMIMTVGARYYTNTIGRNGLVFDYMVCQAPL